MRAGQPFFSPDRNFLCKFRVIQVALGEVVKGGRVRFRTAERVRNSSMNAV